MANRRSGPQHPSWPGTWASSSAKVGSGSGPLQPPSSCRWSAPGVRTIGSAPGPGIRHRLIKVPTAVLNDKCHMSQSRLNGAQGWLILAYYSPRLGLIGGLECLYPEKKCVQLIQFSGWADSEPYTPVTYNPNVQSRLCYSQFFAQVAKTYCQVARTLEQGGLFKIFLYPQV